MGQLPTHMLPNSKETDLLGSEIKRLEEKQIKKPFIYVDLRKWVPTALEISDLHGPLTALHSLFNVAHGSLLIDTQNAHRQMMTTRQTKPLKASPMPLPECKGKNKR